MLPALCFPFLIIWIYAYLLSTVELMLPAPCFQYPFIWIYAYLLSTVYASSSMFSISYQNSSGFMLTSFPMWSSHASSSMFSISIHLDLCLPPFHCGVLKLPALCFQYLHIWIYVYFLSIVELLYFHLYIYPLSIYSIS